MANIVLGIGAVALATGSLLTTLDVNQETIGTILIQIGIPYSVIGLLAHPQGWSDWMKRAFFPLLSIGLVLTMFIVASQHGTGVTGFVLQQAMSPPAVLGWLAIPLGITLAFALGVAAKERTEWAIAILIAVLALPLPVSLIESITRFEPLVATRYLYPNILTVGFALGPSIPVYLLGRSVGDTDDQQSGGLRPTSILVTGICFLQLFAIGLALSLHAPSISNVPPYLVLAVVAAPAFVVLARILSRTDVPGLH